MGNEVIMELALDGEDECERRRFIGYELVKQFYPLEILRFLDKQRLAMI